MPVVQRSNTAAYVDPNGMPQLQASQQMVVPATRMPRADMCLVFPYKTSSTVRYGEGQQDMEEGYRGLTPPTEGEKHKMDMWAQKRHAVITALSDCGLILMLYYSRDRDEIFVKISVEDRHLRQVAEMKRHKLELKEEYLSAFAEYKDDYTGQRELGYSDRIVVSHLYKAHLDNTDADAGQAYPRPNAIFRSTDRIQLITHIVTAADHNCAGIDVGQMLHDGDLRAFFPLHENRKLVDMDRDWFSCFVRGTEITKVRDYFGERIGLYFLFLSHLISWLILPALFGTALDIACRFYGTPDNYAGLIVCCAVGLWYILFVHFWRRQQATHAVKWGTLSIGPTLEPTRPEFQGTSRINPVTGRIDRYYPWSQRVRAVLFSYSVLIVSIVGLLICIGYLFYLRRVFHKHGGRVYFMVLNAILVEILNAVFTWVATKLTEWENHRAYSEHANHLLAKTIVFKFINCYISLYYIAFFKEHGHMFGEEMQCMYNKRTQQNDCLVDCGWQLSIFMINRLVMMNLIEMLTPYFKKVFAEKSEQYKVELHTGFFNPMTVMADMSGPEKQAKMQTFDVYEDMDEILLLYGYTVLFIVAAPWVPLIALISIVVECFLDQKKLILYYRRPTPQPAANNEPWDTAFDVFGFLAVLTNAALFIFSGHTFDKWMHSQKIMLFLCIEFSTILLRIFVSVMLPAIPRRVRLLQLQQDVMVHRHMDLGGEEDDHETRASAMRTTAQPPPYVFDKDQEDDDLW